MTHLQRCWQVAQLHKLVATLSHFYSELLSVFPSSMFPIEMDLSRSAFNYKSTTPVVPVNSHQQFGFSAFTLWCGFPKRVICFSYTNLLLPQELARFNVASRELIEFLESLSPVSGMIPGIKSYKLILDPEQVNYNFLQGVLAQYLTQQRLQASLIIPTPS